MFRLECTWKVFTTKFRHLHVKDVSVKSLTPEETSGHRFWILAPEETSGQCFWFDSILLRSNKRGTEENGVNDRLICIGDPHGESS
jgi:hypothetical protein